MSRSEGQKLKILYIARYLTENTDEEHPATMADLLSYLAEQGISAERKGIYDDLAALQSMGMDILQVGRGKYHLASRTFDLAELQILANAVQSSRFISQRKSSQLIRKLGSLASRAQSAQLARSISVVGRIKGGNDTIFYTVDTLHDAIRQNRAVEFRYFEWTPQKERRARHGGKIYRVSPWRLVWDNQFYYLIAHDPEEPDILKHFRVDKLLDLSVTDAPRTGKKVFSSVSEEDYVARVFGMYSGETRLVTFRCENAMAGVVMDRFGYNTILIPDGPEHFRFRAEVALSPNFYSWVFSLGGKVVMLSPEDVIREYRATLRRALKASPLQN